MTKKPYSAIYNIIRGETVESIHYGSIAIVTPDNKLFAWYGNPRTETYLRSTAKPLQALRLVESGGAKKLGLTLEEIAITCASHSGTDHHKEVLDSLQSKAGIKEDDLMCGTHLPMHQATADSLIEKGLEPTQNRHNCSGKHSGMLSQARLENLPYSIDDQAYIDPEHPIQIKILETFSEMCDLLPGNVHIGIDGCTAPNYAVPISNAALAFARLSDPENLSKKRKAACKTIVEAMTKYPFMVGGPDRFDTTLMEVAHGKLIAKGGAEGYQGIGILPGVLGKRSPGLGIAFKISDGDQRRKIRSAVALEILKQLEVLTKKELKSIEKFGPTFNFTNFRDEVVGRGMPTFKLKYKK